MDEPFLGVVFVVRQSSGHPNVVFHYPPTAGTSYESFFGVGAAEFGKFALPAQWLMNRKLEFEIEMCGSSFNDQIPVSVPNDWRNLRFVSFPCECPTDASLESKENTSAPLVKAFNIVFVFNSLLLTEDQADLFWQALATLSRAILAEESRCGYLSDQVHRLASSKVASEDINLCQILASTYHGLRSQDKGVSIYVNDAIVAHLGVIPSSEAPEPPSGYKAILLTCDSDALQSSLPVDTASNVRRLIDAADPSKTIKDHMIDLGLPISTIQRIAQHLVYWKKARVVPPLSKRLVLALSPSTNVYLNERIREDLTVKFLIKPEKWHQILYAFSQGKKLADIKEILSDDIPQVQNKFTDLVEYLLSKNVLSYTAQYFRYFPPRTVAGGKRLVGLSGAQRPKFQNSLPPEIRSAYSPTEFEIIYERLRFNAVGSELMVKLISNYVKKHKDLLTARVELNEQMRCTNDDFHRYTEALTSGFLDSLLVKYECDLEK